MAEECSWVFESLVGFLRGPVWNVPILTFIENKSLIFEPDCDDDDDHTKIHEEYKNLVDFMLGSYMEDIGITPDQFEAACGKETSIIKDRIQQTLFEQVWAADDYEIFKRMMIQKNLELQLQALDLLQKKYGIIPDSFVSDSNMTEDEQSVMEKVIHPKVSNDPIALEEAERKVLEYALKQSLEEHENYLKEMDAEKREMEEALALSHGEKERLEAEREREKTLLMDAMIKGPEERTAEPSAPPVSAPQNTIDPEEMAKRQAYLREQRDKLLELKKIERQRQLSTFEDAAPDKRPKSSRAARKVMKGSEIDPQTLQVRRTLAERLKAEVINN